MEITVALDGEKKRDLRFFAGDDMSLTIVVYAHDGDITPITVSNVRFAAADGSLPMDSEFVVPSNFFGRVPYRIVGEVEDITTTLAYGVMQTAGGWPSLFCWCSGPGPYGIVGKSDNITVLDAHQNFDGIVSVEGALEQLGDFKKATGDIPGLVDTAVQAAADAEASAQEAADTLDSTVKKPDLAASDGATTVGTPEGTVQEALDKYSTNAYVPDDGTVLGGVNVKAKSLYSAIAPDVRMSYIAFGGHVGFPNIIGSFAGSGASYATISGGYDNIIDCIAGTVSGGAHHRLYGDQPNTSHNTVGGGSYNIVERGEYTTINGGTGNQMKKFRRDGVTAVAPTNSVIGGGNGNKVYGGNATVAGGLNNSSDGDSASVGGGQSNKADGNFSTVAGGGNNETRLGTLGAGQKNTIGGGRNNTIDSATNPGSNTISGGENINVYGSFNSVGGGSNNDVGVSGTEPSYGHIGGGLDNLLSGVINGASILGGRSNVASADYASVTGGRLNSVTAIYARAHGFEAVGRHQSGDTLADGKFAVAGDAQSTVLLRKIVTTTAAVTSMGSIVLPDDSTFTFSALMVARRTDANGESAAYRIEGCIDRNSGAGTTALVGIPTVTVLGEDTAAWDVAAIANAGTGALVFQVTGEASKTINWVTRVTLVEVTG